MHPTYIAGYVRFNTPNNPYGGAYRLSKDIKASARDYLRKIYTEDILDYFETLRYILRKHRPVVEHEVHPAVKEMLSEYGRPTDWHLLALECPQIATDGVRVAYARNEDKLLAHYKDRKDNRHLTATTIAKYLTRHWPHVRQDRIRNIAAKYSVEIRMVTDGQEMVEAVQACTASSCMQWSYTSIEETGAHPYEVYAPKYGWKLAVVHQADKIVGRALALDDGKHKVFVRTYGTSNSNGYSQESDALAGWLESQGYTRAECWPEGTKFAVVTNNDDEPIAPYLDPGSATIKCPSHRNVRREGSYWVRDNYGEYTWDCTDGTMSFEDNFESCEDCGSRQDSDDMTWAGYYSDHRVCSDCLDMHYVEAIGLRGHCYYTRDETVSSEDGTEYVVRHLSANNMVVSHDGVAISIDDAICVDDEYYTQDDVADSPEYSGLIVYDKINREYVLRSDAEWCLHNKDWVSDSEVVIVDGGYVHEDSFDDYLCDLPRDEVAENCSQEELEEKLALWDETNKIEIPAEVETT